MNVVVKKISQVIRYIFDKERVVNTLRFYFTKEDCRLLLNIWIKTKNGKLVHNNWGDDINYFFLKELTQKEIFNLSNMYYFLVRSKYLNILPIGSIIEMRCRRNSIIWGSGMMFNDGKIKAHPYKVLAVRGPLTRELLLKEGIECPEIYGDPALLMPLFFKPNVGKKKYKIGFIPHYKDLDNKFLLEFINTNRDEVILINLKEYNHWHDIPKQINECELILSTSLHGLIISDAYNIPNVWIKFSDKIPGGNFKYLDYFKSVNRTTIEPVEINNSIEMKEIVKLIKLWKPIKFNPEPLIRSCPFELRFEHKDNL